MVSTSEENTNGIERAAHQNGRNQESKVNEEKPKKVVKKMKSKAKKENEIGTAGEE